VLLPTIGNLTPENLCIYRALNVIDPKSTFLKYENVLVQSHFFSFQTSAFLRKDIGKWLILPIHYKNRNVAFLFLGWIFCCFFQRIGNHKKICFYDTIFDMHFEDKKYLTFFADFKAKNGCTAKIKNVFYKRFCSHRRVRIINLINAP